MLTIVQAEEKSQHIRRTRPRGKSRRPQTVEISAQRAEPELVIQAGALSEALIDSIIDEAIVPAYVEASANKPALAGGTVKRASLTAEL